MNVSPKIVINSKNFVFKEAIEQLNKERLWSRKVIPNNGLEWLYTPTKEILSSVRRQNLDPTFNPFEITKKPEKSTLMHEVFAINKSKSDLGYTGNFLNRVKDTSENLPNRRSDITKYNHDFISKNTRSDVESLKSDGLPSSQFSFELTSNKEESTNNENSMFSNEISSTKMLSNIGKKKIMLYQAANEWSESIPTYGEDSSNPFSSPSLNTKVDEASYE